MQLILYSNTLHITPGAELGIGKLHDWSSDSTFLIAITSRSAADIAIYSASIVLIAIKGYILDNHKCEQLEI